MTRTTTTRAVLVASLLLCAVAAHADEPVGRVAALEGGAEAQHTGAPAWAPLAAGDGILLGDRLRTLADGRLKVLLRDESVLTLGASSELTVDEQAIGAEAPASRFGLAVGTLRAVVTERYGKPGARFEVETPTAIAGVRGTSFIATYDAAAEQTVVVGLIDTTYVRSRVDSETTREVRLGPGETTTVRRGSYPLRPSPMPEDILQGLGAATTVSAGGGAAPLATPAPSANIRPRATRPHEDAAAPQQVIDQPLVSPSNKGIAPPPPPAPPPAR
jgi:ferric-dicitrate binding protein FerR (iron transport regulator)